MNLLRLLERLGSEGTVAPTTISDLRRETALGSPPVLSARWLSRLRLNGPRGGSASGCSFSDSFITALSSSSLSEYSLDS